MWRGKNIYKKVLTSSSNSWRACSFSLAARVSVSCWLCVGCASMVMMCACVACVCVGKGEIRREKGASDEAREKDTYDAVCACVRAYVRVKEVSATGKKKNFNSSFIFSRATACPLCHCKDYYGQSVRLTNQSAHRTVASDVPGAYACRPPALHARSHAPV